MVSVSDAGDDGLRSEECGSLVGLSSNREAVSVRERPTGSGLVDTCPACTRVCRCQVLKGIARCLVAEGHLEEAEQRFQKAMGMENARNPGASRAFLEYSQVCLVSDAPLRRTVVP